jgi:hypothetical protein
MSLLVKRSFFVLSVCLLASSCAPKEAPNTKPTIPVKGEVYVDGKPAGALSIVIENVQGDTTTPSGSAALTKDDGTFQVSTYKQDDGAPEGEYALAFSWRQYSMLKRSYTGPDKLNDRYKEAKKSKVRFKVEKGKPVDLGKIELTTK